MKMNKELILTTIHEIYSDRIPAKNLISELRIAQTIDGLVKYDDNIRAQIIYEFLLENYKEICTEKAIKLFVECGISSWTPTNSFILDCIQEYKKIIATRQYEIV